MTATGPTSTPPAPAPWIRLTVASTFAEDHADRCYGGLPAAGETADEAECCRMDGCRCSLRLIRRSGARLILDASPDAVRNLRSDADYYAGLAGDDYDENRRLARSAEAVLRALPPKDAPAPRDAVEADPAPPAAPRIGNLHPMDWAEAARQYPGVRIAPALYR